jgi:hypothetical protein
MKVLFLDIDGVLNSSRSVFVKIGPTELTSEGARSLAGEHRDGLPYGARFGLMCADPVCIALLNLLLEETGATLVLSSTHRMFFRDEHTPYGSEKHLRLLRRYLETMGVRVTDAFDITPRLHTPRGNEVQAWIDERGEPEAYVILDDGRDFDSSQPLVWCDPVNGFDFTNYAEACRQLGVNEPGLILL